ncbi:MAG: YkgJ family cysteine cluster protein [bacterium]|nr:YkgJ family cysteine cluster protein [bacterium]
MSLLNPCGGCGAPCCKDYIITITSFDAVRIAANSKKGLEEFIELAPARLISLNYDTVLECYEDGVMQEHVLALKSHPCVFLDNKNKCTIHKFAPYVCRSYPYNSAKRLIGRARCNFFQKAAFSLAGVSISMEEHSSQLAKYIKIVDAWNAKKKKKEDCIPFLMKKSNARSRI